MDVTKNINLLKKYHKSLVYDYTEYPTKSNWPEQFDEIDYSNSLINWLKNNPNSESLFCSYSILRRAMLFLPLQQRNYT